MKRHIQIMAEYGCHPIWDVTEPVPRNLSALELGMTKELDERFAAWAETFEATLNQEYPPDSGFASQAELEAFEREGLRLKRDLQAALGSEATVDYRPSGSLRDS